MVTTVRAPQNEVAAAARADIQSVFRGALTLFALQLLRTFAASLPGAEQPLGGISARDWLCLGFGLLVLHVLATLYRPASRTALFYLGLGTSLAPPPARDRYRPLLAAPVQIGIQFAFLVFAYDQIPPILARLGPLLQGASGLVVLVQGAALLAGLLVLVTLWRALRPLLDALATDAGEAIAAVSLGIAFAKCPRCLAQTERDGAYCRNCGASRQEVSTGVACASCQRENAPDARFCPGCGAAATEPARLGGA